MKIRLGSSSVVAIFLMLGLCGLGLGFMTRKAPAAWAKAGEPFGLRTEFGLEVRLSGMVDRMPVSAELVGRGSGEHRRTYSQVRVEANLPRNIFFDTSVDTHVLSHIEANMIKELTTGDAVFDEKTRLWGDESEARGFFTPKARALILERADDVRIRLEDGAVITERKGLIRESEPMRRSIETALDVARELR